MKRASIAICIIHCLFLTTQVLSQTFEIRLDEELGGLHVMRAGAENPVMTQNAKKVMARRWWSTAKWGELVNLLAQHREVPCGMHTGFLVVAKVARAPGCPPLIGDSHG